MSITAEDYLERISKVKSQMENEGLDSLLIYCNSWQDGDVKYLTGWSPVGLPMVVLGHGHGSMCMSVFTPEGDIAIFGQGSFASAYREKISWLLEGKVQIDVKPWTELFDYLEKMTKNKNVKTAGFVGIEKVPYPVYNTLLEVMDCELKETDLLKNMRMIKSEKEIELMAKASKIIDEVYSEDIPQLVQRGVTENEAAREIKKSLLSRGADEVPTVLVASGPYASVGFSQPRDEKIRRGNLIQFHITNRYKNYSADVDRGMGFGDIDDDKRKLLEAVKEIHETVKSSVKPGDSGSKLIETIEDAHELAVGSSPWTYTHGTGIQFEELGYTTDWTLQEGMTFTLAQGAFKEGVGGVRAEDVCVMTKNGLKFLSNFDRGFIIK